MDGGQVPRAFLRRGSLQRNADAEIAAQQRQAIREADVGHAGKLEQTLRKLYAVIADMISSARTADERSPG